jgi:hypothetical protein
VTSPYVRRISGDVAAEGEAILLCFESEGEVSEICLARSDVGGLVNMLLALASISGGPGSSDSGDPLSPTIEVVSIGETADGGALLGVEIGGIGLKLRLPRAALRQLALTSLGAISSSKVQ